MSDLEYTHILEQMEASERDAFMSRIYEKINSVKTCELSLYEFTKQAWSIIEGDRPFKEGWHIGAICEHLEACSSRQILRLLINIPPRFMKSTLVGVMWPAWSWINKANEQWLYASHTAALSTRDSINCRAIISSEWYQERWADRFQLYSDQNTKTRYSNNKGGSRIATSVGSKITGWGATMHVLDDPNNAMDRSEASLTNTNEWMANTWFTRKNDPKTDVFIVVQQRISELDCSAFIMSNDLNNEWVKLILPMEFELSRRAKTIILPSTDGRQWEDPRRAELDLLWPEHYDKEEVEKTKLDLKNQYNIAGQLQQRPAPAEGGLIKKQWFQIWRHESPPKLEFVVQSWDTAFSSNKKSDYSACVTFGVFYDKNRILNLILLNAYRGQLDYPDLRRIAQEFYYDYRANGVDYVKPDGHHRPDLLLIEKESSGHSLVQDFRRAGIPAIAFDPKPFGDKENRVKKITHLLEAGRIWVPAKEPDFKFLRRPAEMLVENCAIFPNGKSRDIVDAMTQALIRLNLSGWISHPNDTSAHDTSMRIKRVLY